MNNQSNNGNGNGDGNQELENLRSQFPKVRESMLQVMARLQVEHPDVLENLRLQFPEVGKLTVYAMARLQVEYPEDWKKVLARQTEHNWKEVNKYHPEPGDKYRFDLTYLRRFGLEEQNYGVVSDMLGCSNKIPYIYWKSKQYRPDLHEELINGERTFNAVDAFLRSIKINQLPQEVKTETLPDHLVERKRKRVCSSPGCNLRVLARGLCSKHYQRLWNQKVKKMETEVKAETLPDHQRMEITEAVEAQLIEGLQILEKVRDMEARVHDMKAKVHDMIRKIMN